MINKHAGFVFMDVAKSPVVASKVVSEVKNLENKLIIVTPSEIMVKPGNKNNISTLALSMPIDNVVRRERCSVNRNITDEASSDIDHIRNITMKILGIHIIGPSETTVDRNASYSKQF